MVGGYVKLNWGLGWRRHEPLVRDPQKVNKILETHQLEPSSCNFSPPLPIEHGIQEDCYCPEKGVVQRDQRARSTSSGSPKPESSLSPPAPLKLVTNAARQ